MAGSGCLIKTEVFREVGGYYDVKYAQDFSLLVKVRKAGYGLYNIEEPLYNYCQHQRQVSMVKYGEQQECRARIEEEFCLVDGRFI